MLPVQVHDLERMSRSQSRHRNATWPMQAPCWAHPVAHTGLACGSSAGCPLDQKVSGGEHSMPGRHLLLAAIAKRLAGLCRQREKPQRPLPVWGCDVSKQAVSSLAAHICGGPVFYCPCLVQHTCQLVLRSLQVLLWLCWRPLPQVGLCPLVHGEAWRPVILADCQH